MSATSKARAALAVATAAGGVGVAVGYGGRSILKRQAATARRLIGKPLGEEALDADKLYRKRYGGRPVELLVLGDSIAAGLGAEVPGDTFGARLAKHVARSTERPVRLRTGARVGAESSMLAEQVGALPATYAADVAVIVVGGNDVTHRVPLAESARHLRETIEALTARGTRVVVGTCPDLGALRPVPQPLRSLGSRASRQLAAAQREAALRAGAWAVSLADVVGPFFITNPDEMFSLDRFHPSAAGYKRTAKAVLPSVLAALGEVDAVPFGHHAPEVPEVPDVPEVPEVVPETRPHLRAMPDVDHDDWGIDDQVDGGGFDRREA
ncbi:SGNH/GDSL hydrolase family protein [Nocardioides zeae]|uniref:Lysophospholipase L1-like esterase n=1 Tax=Nocardioides zeae TaxID=1457234 RepID=A0AAJ1X2Q8_9ACTN|nr:SGNH/GDSL hydrolase family protein [Nocardioides zeae]MDQ1104784.1 lysophospholipase L1-like esterase [Nocardioides zeae]